MSMLVVVRHYQCIRLKITDGLWAPDVQYRVYETARKVTQKEHAPQGHELPLEA